MTSEWPWAIVKITLYSRKTCPQAQIFIHFTPWPAVFEIPLCQKSDMHWMTSDWAWSLNCHKYPVYTEYLPQSPNVCMFYSTASRFQDTRLSKITNAPNDLRLTLNTLTVKSTLYTLTTCPEAQISLRFTLRWLLLKITFWFSYTCMYVTMVNVKVPEKNP